MPIDHFFLGQTNQRILIDPEYVTYNSRSYTNDATATFTSYTLWGVVAEPIAVSESFASGLALDAVPSKTFFFYSESLNNAVLVSSGAPAVCPNPKLGDELVDAVGITWRIQKVDSLLEFNGWGLTAQRVS